MGQTSGFDLSAAIVGVSRAVETEICEGIFAPLERIGAAAWGGAEARRRIYGPDLSGRLTLGYAARRLLELEPAARELELPAFQRLVRNRSWHRWLERFVALRNQGAHGEELNVGNAKTRYKEIFSHESPLLDVLPPKAELALQAGDRR
jgi:hypothetical protein